MINSIFFRVHYLFFSIIAAAGCFCFDGTGDASDIKKGAATDEVYTAENFRDDFNGDKVDTSVWQVATWNEHGGQTGTERCYVKDGYLNLVFINDPVKGFLSSAIQTRREFLYGRWEARLKVSDVPGVLNSMYTIDWDDTSDSSSGNDGTKQEIDIEFLTKSFSGSNGEVHAAVHASGKKSFNTNPDLKTGFNPSSDFHIWGFEITPDYIEWFVDGKILLTYRYSEHDVAITAPYQLKMNFWSQSGTSTWIGGPPTPETVCTYQVDWISFTPL